MSRTRAARCTSWITSALRLSRTAVLFSAALAAAAAQTCRPDQVQVTTRCCDGAMGSLYAQVLIRNTSREACLLEGVRKAAAFDEAVHPLPLTLRANEDLDKYGKGSRRLALPPGGTAAITVTTAGPLYDKNRCGRRLRLEIGSLAAEWEMPACGPPGQRVQVLALGLYPVPDGR